MGGRLKLDPQEHISGEWNIIHLNRYLPLSNGDRSESYDSPAELVQKAKELYSTGMTNVKIAEQLNVSRAVVGYWKSHGFNVAARGNQDKRR